MILRLAWAPKYLAEEASEYSTIQAAFAGIASLICMTVLPFSAIGGSVGEPYRDLGEYIEESTFVTPITFLFLAFVWSLVYFVIFIVFIPGSRTRHAKMMLRMVFLGPITLLVPGIAWSAVASLSVLAHPDMNFYGPGGKPAWLTWMPIWVFGSGFWMIAGFLWLAARCRSARRQIGRFLTTLECRRCGYNLTGNVSGRCPECGAAVMGNYDAHS